MANKVISEEEVIQLKQQLSDVEGQLADKNKVIHYKTCCFGKYFSIKQELAGEACQYLECP